LAEALSANDCHDLSSRKVIESRRKRMRQRQQQIAALVEYYQSPRYRGVLESADVVMPGGSSECGGSVEIYLKAGEEGRIRDLSFTAQGDIISQGATSMVLEQVLEEELTMEEVLALDYEKFVDRVGREAVGSRTSNAILGLSTLKSAVRKHQRDNLHAGSTGAEPVREATLGSSSSACSATTM
jgi:nitrogen fixation protein NifU and related proteins